MDDFTTRSAPNLTPYVPLVAGSVARSLACLSCYPIELARTRMQVSCIVLNISAKPMRLVLMSLSTKCLFVMSLHNDES
jgi:hypothetical protein